MQTVCSAKQPQKKAGVYATTAPDGIAAVVITEDLFKRTLAALACIRERIGCLSHVVKLAYSPKGQLITLWTFVNDNSAAKLRSIYKAEQEIMKDFSDLRFDFTVILDPKAEAPSQFITETCLR